MSWVGIAGKLLPRFARERIALAFMRRNLEERIGKPATEKIMHGWKTKVAAVVLMLTGALAIAKEIADGTFNFDEISKGMVIIGNGLAALGIGHKLDKAADAAKEKA